MLQVATAERVANPDLQRRVRELVQTVGATQAARTLGLSRQTLANLAAGFPVHPATVHMAEARAPR